MKKLIDIIGRYGILNEYSWMSAKGQLCNFKMLFWCHRLDQNTNEIFCRISALASKKRSNQKRALYATNSRILF